MLNIREVVYLVVRKSGRFMTVFEWCDGVGNDADSVLPFFQTRWVSFFFSLLFWLFWTVTGKCKNGGNAQREEKKRSNKNNQHGKLEGERKKEVRYFLSDLLLIIDRSDFCFATVFAWRSPLSFLSPDASW